MTDDNFISNYGELRTFVLDEKGVQKDKHICVVYARDIKDVFFHWNKEEKKSFLAPPNYPPVRLLREACAGKFPQIKEIWLDNETNLSDQEWSQVCNLIGIDWKDETRVSIQ